MLATFGDDFLVEVGLGNLPEPERSDLLGAAREEFELRVGTALSAGLSSAELDQFDAFIQRDVGSVSSWLEEHSPEFSEDPLFIELLKGAGPQFSDEEILCEYAAVRWISVHRPDYREVMQSEYERMVAEFSSGSERLLRAMGIE
jgi:hypothetical protein